MTGRRLIKSVILAGIAAPHAWAQISTHTPREEFTSQVSGIAVKDLKFKPFADSLSEESSVTGMSSTAPLPKPPAKPSKHDTMQMFPFYLSAKEYLKKRGADTQTELTLTYKVSVASALTNIKLAPKTAILRIGPDYAAITQDNKTKIFDFKTGRRLTVEKDVTETNFRNRSVYPAILNNINTVNAATDKGKTSSIPIGKEQRLDAFWLESSLGWAARESIADLKVTRESATVTARFKDQDALLLELSGTDMPSEDHMRSFYAYLLHDQPVHPAILPKAGRPDKAPASIMILSYTPQFPNGLKAYWDLQDSEISQRAFPLDPETPLEVSGAAMTPLVFAITQAARNEALKNRPSPHELRDNMHAQIQAGEIFEAWISAQTLAQNLGGCENGPALLCQDIADLESRADGTENFPELLDALNLAAIPSTRAKGFEALVPFVTSGQAPAFLVKAAGQVRSRIPSKSLSGEAAKTLTAEALLTEALIKDPYDPEIYLTLAQVYAAENRLEESWDLQDALRNLPRSSEKLARTANRAEAAIKRMAPGFFAPKGP